MPRVLWIGCVVRRGILRGWVRWNPRRRRQWKVCNNSWEWQDGIAKVDICHLGPAATSARTTLRATTLGTVPVGGTPEPTSAPGQDPERTPVQPDSGLSRDNKIAIILGTVVPTVALIITVYFMRRYRPQQIWDRLRHPFQSQDTEMSTLSKC